MDWQLAALCALTFIIQLIGTLAYAVRIAGVRTRRIAVSFALFNILVLVSRTSNSFQGPFLAKRIELSLHDGSIAHLLADFRWLLASATLATVVGAILVPTSQRIFSRAVLHFQAHRSIPKLLMHGFAKGGLSYIRDAVTIPSTSHLAQLRSKPEISMSVIGLNVAAQALVTVAVFASLYAGALNPAYRVTASTLSSVVNGVATILLFVFIDPHPPVQARQGRRDRGRHADRPAEFRYRLGPLPRQPRRTAPGLYPRAGHPRGNPAAPRLADHARGRGEEADGARRIEARLQHD